MEAQRDHSFGIIPFHRDENGWHFLLIKHNEGHWSFPKGHKETGESDKEAAMRELKEETGIKNCKIVGNNYFIEKYTFERDGGKIEKTVKFFLEEVNKEHSINLQKKEISEYKWLTFEEALKTLTFENGRKLLGEVKYFLDSSYK